MKNGMATQPLRWVCLGLLLGSTVATAHDEPRDNSGWWDDAWWDDSQIVVPENHRVETTWASYQSGDVEVSALVARPEGTGKYPAVLFLHGRRGLDELVQRLARRMGLGIGRSGAISGHGSGDIFVAFSTANRDAHDDAARLASLQFVPDSQIDRFFTAVIQAIDEAVMNALFANESMTGRDGHTVPALPHAAVLAELRARGVVLTA